MREKIPGFCEQKYQEFLEKKRQQPAEILRREQVQELLLDAIEQGGTSDKVVSLGQEKTGLSERSVRKRLAALGYLRQCGRSFLVQQGFARR